MTWCKDSKVNKTVYLLNTTLANPHQFNLFMEFPISGNTLQTSRFVEHCAQQFYSEDQCSANYKITIQIFYSAHMSNTYLE